MTSKLINPAWQYLRQFLQPGKRPESAPKAVDDDLVVVVDSEHWVPVPRYMARIDKPAQGAGIHSVIQLGDLPPDALGQPLGAGPMAFAITDFFVRSFTQFTVAQVVSTNGGGAQTMLNVSPLGVDIKPFSGDASQSIWRTGQHLVAGNGPLILNTFWTPLPDLEPGHNLQFVGNVNAALILFFQWAERRPLGVMA